jgi:hypothetical protein
MANFIFNPPFPSQVAGSDSKFQRTFRHRAWVDGQDLVQAGSTPDEEGMNSRLRKLEIDLDAIKSDLVNAHHLISDLRTALAAALNQIRDELNSKTDKPTKESKEGKEGKDAKEGKDSKDTKEAKDGKESKEGKDTKEHKDGKESKEGKERKDGKELSAKEQEKAASFIEKRDERGAPMHLLAGANPLAGVEPDAVEEPVGRAFIRNEERPRVGARLYDNGTLVETP